MRLLLDTHVFLWFISGDKRLSSTLQESIRMPGNDVYLSVISIWESQVKYQLGKLPLPQPPVIYLPVHRKRHLIESLPLDQPSISQLSKLPLLHRDPFDRMLICQALEHGLTVATVDPEVLAYPVDILS